MLELSIVGYHNMTKYSEGPRSYSSLLLVIHCAYVTLFQDSLCFVDTETNGDLDENEQKLVCTCQNFVSYFHIFLLYFRLLLQ